MLIRVFSNGKDCLTVMYACKHLDYYIHGSEVVIWRQIPKSKVAKSKAAAPKKSTTSETTSLEVPTECEV